MCIYQIIVPNEKAVRKLASDQSLLDSPDSAEWKEVCQNEKVQKAVLNEMNGVGKKAGLKPIEVSLLLSLCALLEMTRDADLESFRSLQTLQCVILSPEEWTPNNGFLTAAQKLQRKVILKEFEEEIKKVYP